MNSSGVNGHHRTPLSTMDNTPLSLFFGQSSFAAYSTTSAKNVVKVDRDVDLRLLGPLGCGFMTGSGTILNALKPEPGSSIAIFGTGAVGLAGIMAAQIAGCSKIIAIDIHSQRLELAQTLGATHVVNSMNKMLWLVLLISVAKVLIFQWILRELVLFRYRLFDAYAFTAPWQRLP